MKGAGVDLTQYNFEIAPEPNQAGKIETYEETRKRLRYGWG